MQINIRKLMGKKYVKCIIVYNRTYKRISSKQNCICIASFPKKLHRDVKLTSVNTNA